MARLGGMSSFGSGSKFGLGMGPKFNKSLKRGQGR